MSAIFRQPTQYNARRIPCAADIEQTIKEFPIGIQR